MDNRIRKIIKNWKYTFIFLILILILGLFLRLFKLTYLPIFGDEAIYIRWAQIMRAEPTLRFISLTDGKQPLFMWFLMPFIKIFEDPLFAGRLASVVCGLLTALGIFVLSYLLFKSKKVSLIALLIYCFSPFGIFFDKLAMADSMLSMFGIWVFIFGMLLVKLVRLDVAMITGFVLASALLTKSPALYFSLLLPLNLIFIDLKKYKKLIRFTELIFLLGLVYLIAYGIYNFLLRLGPNFQMIALRNRDYIFPISHLWENPMDPFKFHLDRAIEWFINYGTASVSFLFVLSLVFGIRKYLKEYIFLSGLFILPILANSMFARSFTTRYIYFTFPYFVIIASVVFIEKLTKHKWFSNILNILLIIFIFQSVYFFKMVNSDLEKVSLARTDRSGFLEEWTSGTGIKEVSEIIKNEYNLNPSRKIVVGTEGYFGTLPDGLQIYLTKYPQITVIGVGIDLKEIPKSLIESVRSGNETYLVINSSRLKMPLENTAFEVLAVYPKAFRPNFVHEYSLHGPRDNLYLIKIKNVP